MYRNIGKCIVVLAVALGVWGARSLSAPQAPIIIEKPTDVFVGVRAFTPADLREFEAWFGRPASFVLGFADGPTWDKIVQKTHQQDSIPASKPLMWAMALATNDTTLASTAAGASDVAIAKIAGVMTARPQQIIYVRLGWEQNLRNPWTSVGHEGDYIAAFRHVAMRLKSIDPRFRMEWCPGMSFSYLGIPYNPEKSWPGDDVVDRVCMDVYYTSSHNNSDGTRAFIDQYSAAYGLKWLADFGRIHHKPLSIGEWGMNADVPGYVAQMANFVATNHVQSIGIWNRNVPGDPKYQDRLSAGQHPASGQAVIHYFGTTHP